MMQNEVKIFGPMGALRMQLFSGLPERVNYFTLTSLTLQSQDVCLDLLDLLHHLLSSSMKVLDFPTMCCGHSVNVV
ncbi:hypothetical protein GDO81_011746 [Engystomops pustulosus]|uniref:Uncharacterized protein n=1 Tax=Engystomops pustulosus TaxID=76066 RepID=A0AAV7BGZ3_ENGPU|nr:hypothetical protein GDO81_011746 [Engystomops pustulosus]